MRFVDRVDAGRRLAERLRHLRGEDVVVLGLPRGGVPVAAEVARALGAPLDVIVVRKLGVPSRPELAMGAVGEDGVLVVNQRVVRGVPVNETGFAEVERQERQEVARRARRFRGDRTRLPLAGRTALIVDDGVATGSTARAACRIARAQGAARVVLAAPVCASEVADALGDVIDEAVCLMTPERFFAVGQFYADFRPTSDGEVVELLRRGAHHATSGAVDPPPGDPVEKVDADGVGGVGGVGEEVEVVAGGAQLGGELSVPAGARGLVVFVHGSGSSRHSPRNRYVAGVLQAAGLATLLFDLLTRREELDRATVFDVGLLAGRLIELTSWVRAHPQCRGLRVGYFGASTGAVAALWAATTNPTVAAVISRGGRLDLAAPCLEQVRAPTLLVVGGRDAVVLEVRVGQQQRDGPAAKVPRRLGCARAAAASGGVHDRVTGPRSGVPVLAGAVEGFSIVQSRCAGHLLAALPNSQAAVSPGR